MHSLRTTPPPPEINDIWTLARELADRIQRVEARASVGQIGKKAQYTDERLAIVAATIFRLRTQRAKLFDAAFFGEPAWDILLELFLEGVRGKRSSLKSVCIGADVPLTTGLRHVDQLCKAGLVKSKVDRNDRRVRIVALTPQAQSLMREFLSEAATRLGLSANPTDHEVQFMHGPGIDQP